MHLKRNVAENLITETDKLCVQSDEDQQKKEELELMIERMQVPT